MNGKKKKKKSFEQDRRLPRTFPKLFSAWVQRNCLPLHFAQASVPKKTSLALRLQGY